MTGLDTYLVSGILLLPLQLALPSEVFQEALTHVLEVTGRYEHSEWQAKPAMLNGRSGILLPIQQVNAAHCYFPSQCFGPQFPRSIETHQCLCQSWRWRNQCCSQMRFPIVDLRSHPLIRTFLHHWWNQLELPLQSCCLPLGMVVP